MKRRQGARGGWRRLLRRDQRGVAMVEFAFVLIPFSIILSGLVAMGTGLAIKQQVTSAAADGARAAVGASVFSDGVDGARERAQSRVQSKLGMTGYTATYLPYVEPDPLAPKCPSPALCIEVAIHRDLPSLPGLEGRKANASAVVQYK